MTVYRVEYHAKGSAAVIGLPADAFGLLIERLAKISRDPWGETEPDDENDPPPQAFRQAAFGDARGLVQVFIDDERRVVRVHGIVWAG